MGGEPLAERLRDKDHSWSDLRKLVPNMLLAGLMGYPFSCPDMIGGGEYKSFQAGATIDQDLVVRSAPVSYTHLDVYKRQPWVRCRFCQVPPGPVSAALPRALASVSR